MIKTTIASRLAAIVCTLLVSATCLLGAVGPATANGQATTLTTRAVA